MDESGDSMSTISQHKPIHSREHIRRRGELSRQKESAVEHVCKEKALGVSQRIEQHQLRIQEEMQQIEIRRENTQSTVRDETVSAAFNLGCEARLAGESFHDNPYNCRDSDHYKFWREGWRDVDQNWGMWNRESRKLPAVRG